MIYQETISEAKQDYDPLRSFQEDSLANLTVLQENVRLLLMSAISGLNTGESFARLCRDGSWAKTWGGLLSSENGRFFGGILRDLAELGYHAFWYCFPAYAVGALYERERVAIAACSDCDRLQRFVQQYTQVKAPHRIQGSPSEDIRAALSLWNGKGTYTDRIRTDNGVPNWAHRIKTLGNTVNPYQFYPIFRAIADIERGAS